MDKYFSFFYLSQKAGKIKETSARVNLASIEVTILVGPREKIVMAVMVHGPSILRQLPFWLGYETPKYCQSLLEGTGRVGKPVGISRLRNEFSAKDIHSPLLSPLLTV